MDAKKLKLFANDGGTKTVWKQLGAGKKTKRRTTRTISRKSRLKNSRSSIDIFDRIN